MGEGGCAAKNKKGTTMKQKCLVMCQECGCFVAAPNDESLGDAPGPDQPTTAGRDESASKGNDDPLPISEKCALIAKTIDVSESCALIVKTMDETIERLIRVRREAGKISRGEGI